MLLKGKAEKGEENVKAALSQSRGRRLKRFEALKRSSRSLNRRTQESALQTLLISRDGRGPCWKEFQFLRSNSPPNRSNYVMKSKSLETSVGGSSVWSPSRKNFFSAVEFLRLEFAF